MKREFSLFGSPGRPGSLYERVRTREPHVRERVDQLWSEYRRLADRHFETEFRERLHERFWEMYLACTLLERGREVDSSNSGPDVLIRERGGCVWIEAVCPSQGDPCSSDRVPDLDFNGVHDYPSDKVVLRYRSSIGGKVCAYQEYVSAGAVNPSDPFVIAVSAAQLEAAFTAGPTPDILKAVYPIGCQQIHVRLDASADEDEHVGPDFQHRPVVYKSNDSGVATNIFLDPCYAQVSAVLFSDSNVLNPPLVNGRVAHGSEFLLVHNLSAANPLPHGWLGFGTEYVPRLSGDSLSLSCVELPST